MFGQRASSHTVCSFRWRSPRFSRFSDSKWVLLLFAHSGRRGRAGAGGAPPPICTSESITLVPHGPESGVFQFRLGPAVGGCVFVWPHQHARQVARPLGQRNGKALVLERLPNRLG